VGLFPINKGYWKIRLTFPIVSESHNKSGAHLLSDVRHLVNYISRLNIISYVI